MTWLHRLLDFITAVGGTLAVLGGSGTISPKWAAFGGAGAAIAGKLASSPAWFPQPQETVSAPPPTPAP